ncbi:MAG: adenosylcobalamin-dependent ribonucleoside-diphosphate reductase [Bacteroidales bacterium]|nr:adenosylcobalamin-dependent ribonucleoside-diphosphate reductase [Bacteroidales bacterium]
MEKSLFSTIDEKQETTSKSNAYDKIAEKRSRPNIFEEAEQTEETVENKKVFTFEEALEQSTEYFNGDTLAASVWVSKYALKDSAGSIFESTPDMMHKRIASEIARIEKKYENPLSEEEIYSVLKNFKYIVPQGSPMAGIGNNFQVASLSNCFVIGNSNADSYGGIMKVDEEQVQLMKRRGGVGHDLSHIRPKGSPVKNSALTSTGVVPFMERYSNSTREVAQDGRRGALMLSISVTHPDSENFIDAKMEQGKVTGANVSVKITDAFMQSLINKTPFTQKYPVDSANPTFSKSIDADKLWDKVVHNAWKSAEPGILFWDTIKRESIPDCYADQGFETVSTNPCGEIPLCPYDSCRLLAINLYGYVENPFTEEASFNLKLFREHIWVAQRMMDDIIDLELEKVDRIIEKIEKDPEAGEIKNTELNLWQKIKEKAIQGRRTGIGITAEGDMLASLGMQYGSDEAIDFSVNIHKTLAVEAYKSSVNLAKERGAFPIYDYKREEKNPLINRLFEAEPQLKDYMKEYGRRNIALLTIAPTGSVSILTQTTSGIEPAFMVSYKRRKKVNPNDKNAKVSFVDEIGDSWEEYTVFHPRYKTWLEANGYDVNKVKNEYSEEQIQDLIKKSPYHKATSNDVDWVSKVKMQGAIQKWVDHSISVTVNVPNDVKEDLIDKVYRTAWESGCKGVTVYRDGSRSGVLVSSDSKTKKEEGFTETHAPIRPYKLESRVVRFSNGEERWVAVVGILEGRPYEIFTGKADSFILPDFVNEGWVIREKKAKQRARYDFEFLDKDGYEVLIKGLSRTFDPKYWNYAKLISGVLRHGMPLPNVIHLIENLVFDRDTINTWKNGVVRALKAFIPDGTKAEGTCPECHTDALEFKEGCLTCSSCGYSKCG